MAEDTITEFEIAPEEVARLAREEGAELIDVRRAYEWEGGHLEGSRHIEINQVSSEAETVPQDRPVVFYCRTGSRSALAAAAFSQAGWRAHNMAGGIVAWVARGLPLEPQDGTIVEPRPAS